MFLLLKLESRGGSIQGGRGGIHSSIHGMYVYISDLLGAKARWEDAGREYMDGVLNSKALG